MYLAAGLARRASAGQARPLNAESPQTPIVTHRDKFFSRSPRQSYIIVPVMFLRLMLHGVPVMPSNRIFLLLAGMLALASLSYVAADGPEPKTEANTPESKTAEPISPTAADEQVLKGAHLEVNGAALLEFLRKRTPGEVKRDQVEALIRQLGGPKPEVRDKAAGDLVKLGVAAVPLLHVRSRDLDDPDLAARAKQCLEAIQNPALLAAAVRLLAERNPEGTSETLLGYLPFADDDQLENEIVQTLAAVCFRGGQPNAALLKALEDPVPLRRATAAELLCRHGGPTHRASVRKLLSDPKPHVRMRTALVLAEFHDAEAVPAMIDILGELPAGQCRPVEEYLMQLAGEWSLTVPTADDPTGRRLRRDLWAAWWRSLDGPFVVEEFRKHTVTDAERDKAEAIIRRLASDSDSEREKAEAE